MKPPSSTSRSRVGVRRAPLREQLACVDARRPPVVATDRPAPTCLRQRLDGQCDAAALLLSVEEPDLLPAPAVAAGLVPGALDPPADFRVPLDRQRGCVD